MFVPQNGIKFMRLHKQQKLTKFELRENLLAYKTSKPLHTSPISAIQQLISPKSPDIVETTFNFATSNILPTIGDSIIEESICPE